MSLLRPSLLRSAVLLAALVVTGCSGEAGQTAAAADADAAAGGDGRLGDGLRRDGAPDAAPADRVAPADARAPDIAEAGADGGPEGPVAAVSPEVLVFGAVAAGATETRTLTVRNAGALGTLTLLSVAAQDGTSAEFSVGAPDRTALGPGAAATVVVTYAPRDAAPDGGAVVVTHDAGTGPVVVPLRAEPQAPALCFQPPAIEFGEIPPGREAALQFGLANCGTGPTEVVDLALSPEASRDYALEDGPALPLPLAPGAEAFVGLRYRPTGANADHGAVVATFRDAGGRLAYASAAVSGAEPATGAPLLVVRPEAVRFEGVLLGTPQTQAVTLGNEGGAALSLQSVALAEGAHAALALADAPVPGTLVAAGAERAFRVVFAPEAPFPHDGAPLGAVVIRSNDAAAGVCEVPIHATSGAPHLAVVPPDGVDFGVVGQHQTVAAAVTLRNVGGAPLEVRDAHIAPDEGAWGDEFRIAGPPALDPPLAGGLGSLSPGQAAALPLTFTNNGPDHGLAGATLSVTTDDPSLTTATVRLTAERALDPTLPESGVVLEPTPLDLGAVAPGGETRGFVLVRNVANSERRLVAARIGGCAYESLGWGSRLTCDPRTPAEGFALAAPLPAGGSALAPGQALPLEVVYTAGTEPERPDGQLLDRALLQVTVEDPAGQPAAVYDVPPEPDGDGALPPNLEARCAWPDGFPWPPVVELGDVPVGCLGTETLFVTATGPVPLHVLAVEPAPACGETFALLDPAPLPPEGLVATDAAPAALVLGFRPPAVGAHGCDVTLRTDDAGDPTYVVGLVGTGVEEGRVEDTFVHRDAPRVDVLFVVDDSGSMCEEQERLAENLSDFIENALTWGNDFRIGVVDTCAYDETACEGVGALRTAHPPARWVTPATWRDFLDNVQVGCWGPGYEAGLQAAHRALTPPAGALGASACAADGDCVPPYRCLPDLGRCGGASGGFLRGDAALEIAILSDEEDQSDLPVSFYVSFFQSLRNLGKGGGRVHVIVGDEGTGCTGGGTFATQGDRYIEAARATRGIVASICDDSFAEPLRAMGELAFATRWTYPLSVPADPATLLVTVAGRDCAEGWWYVPADNAIEFTVGGPCTPQDGDAISVKYDRLCE